jgi:hypothetical protein
MNYNGQNQFSFLTMIHALNEPGILNNSENIQQDTKVDAALLMMLGSKAAIEYIDHEVGRLQDAISF